MPERNLPRIVIFGATGRLGRLLVKRFHEAGHPIVSIGRNSDALAELPGEYAVLDLDDSLGAAFSIRAGDIVINTVHARYTAAIMQLCPGDIERFIVIGSARYLSAIPDAKADDVRAAARHLQSGKLPWVLLHPTMIYGASGENNVQRMAALIRRFHIIPLPGAGRTLIQPIHVRDVAEAVMRVVKDPEVRRATIHLAGPEAVTYSEFLRAIADAAGSWVVVAPVPLALARLIARSTTFLPGVPAIRDAEVRRLMEDKTVDTSAMTDILDLAPRPLKDGLAEIFVRT